MPNMCRPWYAQAVRIYWPGTDFAFDRYDRLLNAVSQSHVAIKETTMQWTTPAYSDLRFGFEITMYIANR
ncbi:Coenzyme PQQ synthesis protein A [Paraburkholderia domus]|nr:Coenzyme PQQ synthesis protein A [Paraburkholderia domus]CAE6938866.1 Coenzyme PQQ synthesis protein A [Paraburkholderia domus]CAE6946474.1 Coenzyme PQQ synthesis protein A [Paraburkholderia domus]CAE6950821.1 Coenzyme PQQ synthesis protein A [Paraburkholderia domus]